MSLLALQFGVFLGAALLTGLFRRYATHVQLMDYPVARSSHRLPTPVGGGVSIAVLFLLLASYFFLRGLIPFNHYMALLATSVVAIVGLVDDLVQLDIQWRLPPQLLAAVWVLWWLGGVPTVQIGNFLLDSPWIMGPLAVLALLWLLNLYNFMDGIDGLAASELVFVNVVSCLLVINSGDNTVALLSATLLAAGAGFLLWNWPPAKIFMGDVGSGFIGFSLGVLALISMQHGSLSVWTWVILLSVFIVDATTTLIRRYLRGDKWYEGHATHAYQHAARLYKSHAKVTITVVLINFLWLAPLAWVSVRRPELGIYLSIVAMLPLLVLALKLGAGSPDKAAASTEQ